MKIPVDLLFFVTEIIGTIAFAISGAMTAIERKLDLFGVLFLGATTAIGGGIVRDILLGQIPPKAFLNYVYMLTAVVTAAVVFLFSYINSKREKPIRILNDDLLNFFDAAGLGIFSVIGVQNTINAGFGENAFFCIFLGMLTGVGGGVLRDMMCADIPFVLRKHIYAVAAIAGAVVFYYTVSFGLDQSVASLLGMLTTFLMRVLAWHYRWNLPRAVINDPKGKSI